MQDGKSDVAIALIYMDPEVIRRCTMGRFTIIEVKDKKSGRKAIGVSKRGHLDSANPKMGNNIAYGRAVKALKIKLAGGKAAHHYMG